MNFLTKLLNQVDDDAGKIIVSFHPSTKRLEEAEIRKINQDKDISFIRGTVQVKYLIDNDFGIANWNVYYTERNVSFGRFEREVINHIDMSNGGFTVDGFDFEEVFPSF